MENKIVDFIEKNIERVSDIHILEDELLSYRTSMDIHFSSEVVYRKDIEEFLILINKEKLLDDVYKKYNIDYSFEIFDYRFRGNIFLDRKKIAISLRKISKEILALQSLGLPKEVEILSKMSSGLVFITGPTGSGKSTTMSSIIEHINRTNRKHIITIEDPIEQEFESKKSLINQREVGVDVDSFVSAIKSSLRQDPDIIVIGEIRDPETMKVAINAAETGHLCISTLHTLGAVNSIERVIGMFSREEQDSIRYELSLVLRGILSQQLVRTSIKNTPIIPVVELMIGDKSISNMIRDNKINQITNYIITNSEKNLISMDKELINLYKNRYISLDILLEKAIDKDYVSKKSMVNNLSFISD